MSKTLAVAKYLNKLNLQKHGQNRDEMKLHKMMYFSQRESLMFTGNPLFEDTFEAWKFGPVLRSVRKEYHKDPTFKSCNMSLSKNEEELVSSVFDRYDSFDAWDLSSLSHEEFSWVEARRGLKLDDNGSNKIRLSAMKVDAAREKLRRRGVLMVPLNLK